MLDVANKHEKELQSLLMDTWYVERYKYYHCSVYSGIVELPKDNWCSHNFVSLDNDGHIIGYITYSISRSDDRVSGLGAINFSNSKMTFGKDLVQAIQNIFEKYNYRKLSFSVVIGNPIERSYDRLVQKYGGRIVGVNRQQVKLIDNKYYDQKHYEILRDDYMAKIYNCQN